MAEMARVNSIPPFCEFNIVHGDHADVRQRHEPCQQRPTSKHVRQDE